MTKPNAPARSIKIFIIDPSNRKWDASLFSSIGPCDIVRTLDPAEGLTHFVRSSFDVAILCMNDQKQCMAILQFFKSVKPDFPIVVHADLASEDFIISALRADAWDFFKEPTCQEQIVDSVRQALLSQNDIRCSGGDDSPMWKTLKYIDEHLAEHISLGKAACLCEMSVSCFQRSFKREVGLSFNKYVNSIRISKARQLLHDHRRSISDIAYACGFTNPYHFSRTFKKLMYTSPRSFRQSFTPEPSPKSLSEGRNKQI
jgi:AraC-like DNA-binding protein